MASQLSRVASLQNVRVSGMETNMVFSGAPLGLKNEWRICCTRSSTYQMRALTLDGGVSGLAGSAEYWKGNAAGLLSFFGLWGWKKNRARHRVHLACKELSHLAAWRMATFCCRSSYPEGSHRLRKAQEWSFPSMVLRWNRTLATPEYEFSFSVHAKGWSMKVRQVSGFAP